MADEEFDLRQLVNRLSTSRFRSYLVARGWEERPSRYVDHAFFQVKSDDGDNPYELYLPVSVDVPKHHTRVMRAIYKLCGIEDREPLDIVQDMFAIAAGNEDFAAACTSRLRVRNTGSTRLELRLDKPAREHMLLPGETIELSCQVAEAGSLQIDRGDASLTILASDRK